MHSSCQDTGPLMRKLVRSLMYTDANGLICNTLKTGLQGDQLVCKRNQVVECPGSILGEVALPHGF